MYNNNICNSIKNKGPYLLCFAPSSGVKTPQLLFMSRDLARTCVVMGLWIFFIFKGLVSVVPVQTGCRDTSPGAVSIPEDSQKLSLHAERVNCVLCLCVLLFFSLAWKGNRMLSAHPPLSVSVARISVVCSSEMSSVMNEEPKTVPEWPDCVYCLSVFHLKLSHWWDAENLCVLTGEYSQKR